MLLFDDGWVAVSQRRLKVVGKIIEEIFVDAKRKEKTKAQGDDPCGLFLHRYYLRKYWCHCLAFFFPAEKRRSRRKQLHGLAQWFFGRADIELVDYCRRSLFY